MGHDRHAGSEVDGPAPDFPIAESRRIGAAAAADLGFGGRRFGLRRLAPFLGFSERPARRRAELAGLGHLWGVRFRLSS